MSGYQHALGIIGLGTMGEAILRSALHSKQLKPAGLAGLETNHARARTIKKQYKIHLASDMTELAATSARILMAIKPQQMAEVLELLALHLSQEQLVLTIAAGLDLKFYYRFLGHKIRMIRVMPNTPLAVGAGASGYYANRNCTATDLRFAEQLFSASGLCLRVPREELLDAVTALSGSGPAYFFYIFEAMIKAGRSQGLAPKTALMLTAQTALGAAKMLMESGYDPAELRAQVTSKGGTTERALTVFKHAHVDEIFFAAMVAAVERAQALRAAAD